MPTRYRIATSLDWVHWCSRYQCLSTTMPSWMMMLLMDWTDNFNVIQWVFKKIQLIKLACGRMFRLTLQNKSEVSLDCQ